MRICVYSLSPKVGGGVVTKTILLLRYLLRSGHEVVWVYPKVKGALPSYVENLTDFGNLQVIEKRTTKYFRVLNAFDFFSTVDGDFDIHQVISGYCVDGIFFRNKPKNYFIWAATTLRSEKSHNFSSYPKNLKQLVSFLNYKVGLFLERWGAIHAHKIFAASSVSRDKIINEFHLQPDSVLTVHPIVDTEHYSYKPIHARCQIEPYVLFMGIFSKRKNLDLLIRSFAYVNAKMPEIRLKLVGKVNGHEKYFLRLIASLGLSHCVEIIGEVSDNVCWYQNAICTVLTSHEEGFGMVLAESLACGTPVVSTKSGGVSDIVEHQVNGFLVESNEKEISQAILEIYSDIEVRKNFSLKARQSIEARFSVDVIGNQIITEYFSYLGDSITE